MEIARVQKFIRKYIPENFKEEIRKDFLKRFWDYFVKSAIAALIFAVGYLFAAIYGVPQEVELTTNRWGYTCASPIIRSAMKEGKVEVQSENLLNMGICGSQKLRKAPPTEQLLELFRSLPPQKCVSITEKDGHYSVGPRWSDEDGGLAKVKQKRTGAIAWVCNCPLPIIKALEEKEYICKG
jgi:hypothetical protein